MNFKPLLPESVRYIVVHCSATPPEMDIGAKEIDIWHRQRGFFQIGYHKVIRRNGVVEDGRPLDRPGAHALGFNDKSVGVCLVGGVARRYPIAPVELVPENNFTPEQFASLDRVLRSLRASFPAAAIVGHRDLPSKHAKLKDCPSFDVSVWLTNRGWVNNNPPTSQGTPRECGP